MTLTPFYDATGVIQFHIVAALFGMVIGPFVLFRNRRDIWHRRLGYVWIVAMLALALSGLMIPSEIAIVGHMGPIHIFSFLTLWGIAEGLWHIRRGNIRAHRASMQSVWFGALGLAGLFTFLPGRTVNRMVFGQPDDAGYVVIVLGAMALLTGWRVWLRRVA